MPTIHSIQKIEGPAKTIFVRLDLNIPVTNGIITDDTRIIRSVNTVNDLLKAGHKVLLASHFGRPKPSSDWEHWRKKYSLQQIKVPLEKYFSRTITFVSDCGGEILRKTLKDNPAQKLFLLENLRFYPGEVENDLLFSKFLAEHSDVYVNDAFSCSHRGHASVVGITEFLPSFGGYALLKELEKLREILYLKEKGRPILGIVAGAKVSGKLDLLENLCAKLDDLILGGGIANTFLAAKGQEVGDSLLEEKMIPVAKKILSSAKARIHLPVDVVCAANLESKGVIKTLDQVSDKDKIFDIGPKTIEKYKLTIGGAKTILWNGPLGVFECDEFANGSIEIAKIVANLTKDNSIISVAGGGDTASLLSKANVFDDFTFVSTAGGAFLEWLEGKPLPGVIALQR